MSDDRPFFEVTTPAATAAAKRLTTATKVQDRLGIGAVNTSLIEDIINEVSGECASHCRLARAAGADVPTLGQEVVKATWNKISSLRGSRLILPWRVPVTAIGTVAEAGTNLVVNIDFRLIGGCMLERLSSAAPIRWSSDTIVVPYTAGLTLPGSVPPEIEGRVIDQVKMRYLARERDPSVRSEATQDVGSASYNIEGGNSLGASGLLTSLEQALAPFRNEAVI
jgi:hypothetical protein